MSIEKRAEENINAVSNLKHVWTAPELTKMLAGEAETGPGASGETSSLS